MAKPMGSTFSNGINRPGTLVKKQGILRSTTLKKKAAEGSQLQELKQIEGKKIVCTSQYQLEEIKEKPQSKAQKKVLDPASAEQLKELVLQISGAGTDWRKKNQSLNELFDFAE
jgi:hypothetical protein